VSLLFVNSFSASLDPFEEKKKNLHIIVSHQDQIISLPEGAPVIAARDFIHA